MNKVEEYYNLINSRINQLNLPEYPSNLYEPVKYILSIGGKRLRPVLLLLANQMFSGKIENAINQALGIEIFHNFTLLHDDIMDKSSMRRNQPTVHKKWNENIAILSGDTMMFLANQLISASDHKFLKQILDLFNKTALEVCEGQQLDMDFEERHDVTVDEYLEMIKLKTSVLIASSLKMGAITAGANSEDAENLYNFGLNIGLAFQLQDDLLDTYGDEKTFGKKIGNDIVANKKTFLLISALNLAERSDLSTLKNLISEKTTNNTDKIKNVIEIYNKLSIKQITEEKIDFYFKNSTKFFNKIKIDKNLKKELTDYVDKLSSRKF